MPCVVPKIYIVGSFVVVKSGVRVRRNCNIFNLAMENVLKAYLTKSVVQTSYTNALQMYTFF
jgi:hypothetical protein